ncbi:MAG: hypothetical protein WCJ03_06935 [Bacteroidales bacterium]
MKKNIILFILLQMTFPQIFCQVEVGHVGKHFDLENFKAQKQAYLIKEVCLTPEESAQLFPLYNKMQEKRFKLKMEMRENLRTLNKKTNQSNEECLKMIDEVLDKQIQEVTIEKVFYEKFKKVLSPQKLLELKQADFRFAKEMLKKSDNRQIKN